MTSKFQGDLTFLIDRVGLLRCAGTSPEHQSFVSLAELRQCETGRHFFMYTRRPVATVADERCHSSDLFVYEKRTHHSRTWTSVVSLKAGKSAAARHLCTFIVDL